MPIDKSPTLIHHERESFLIPGEVAVAIATRRPGMIQLLTGRLKKSLDERATEIDAGVAPEDAGAIEQLPPVQVVDLLRLLQATLERVEQLDEDLEEANRKRTFFEQSLEDLRRRTRTMHERRKRIDLVRERVEKMKALPFGPHSQAERDLVWLQELLDARDAEIAELKEKLAQAEESESNAWGEAEEYKGRIDSAIALIGWHTLPAPVSSITLRRIRSLLGEDLEGAHVASLREFLEGVPWKVHTPATLQHFPIVITPQSRRLIEEIVPEPQRSWVIEAGEEYMRNRE